MEHNDDVKETQNNTPDTGDKPRTYDKPVSAFDNPTSAAEGQNTFSNSESFSNLDDSATADTSKTASNNTGSTDTYNTNSNAGSSPYSKPYGSTYNSQNSYMTNDTISTTPEVVSTGFGIASLILGILSIPCNCCYGMGLLFSILGIIFGCIQPKDFNGKKPGVAIGGIICSIVGIVLAIFVYIIVFAAVLYR